MQEAPQQVKVISRFDGRLNDSLNIEFSVVQKFNSLQAIANKKLVPQNFFQHVTPYLTILFLLAGLNSIIKRNVTDILNRIELLLNKHGNPEQVKTIRKFINMLSHYFERLNGGIDVATEVSADGGRSTSSIHHETSYEFESRVNIEAIIRFAHKIKSFLSGEKIDLGNEINILYMAFAKAHTVLAAVEIVSAEELADLQNKFSDPHPSLTDHAFKIAEENCDPTKIIGEQFSLYEEIKKFFNDTENNVELAMQQLIERSKNKESFNKDNPSFAKDIVTKLLEIKDKQEFNTDIINFKSATINDTTESNLLLKVSTLFRKTNFDADLQRKFSILKTRLVYDRNNAAEIASMLSNNNHNGITNNGTLFSAGNTLDNCHDIKSILLAPETQLAIQFFHKQPQQKQSKIFSIEDYSMLITALTQIESQNLRCNNFYSEVEFAISLQHIQERRTSIFKNRLDLDEEKTRGNIKALNDCCSNHEDALIKGELNFDFVWQHRNDSEVQTALRLLDKRSKIFSENNVLQFDTLLLESFFQIKMALKTICFRERCPSLFNSRSGAPAKLMTSDATKIVSL